MVKKPRFGHYVVDDTSIYGIDRHSGYRAGVYEATDPAGRIVRLELLPYGSISTGKLREFVERLNAVAKHSRILVPIVENRNRGQSALYGASIF